MKRAQARFLAITAITVISLLATLEALAERNSPPPGAKVYIIWPADGQVIPGGKFWLRMGARGIGVCPAGFKMKNCGHHHVLVDKPLPLLDQQIPSDKNHLHFGRGQIEARLHLPPGRHTLQLLMGDHDHVPHDPPLYSTVINVIVPP